MPMTNSFHASMMLCKDEKFPGVLQDDNYNKGQTRPLSRVVYFGSGCLRCDKWSASVNTAGELVLAHTDGN